jgi:hypothetical protein
MMLRTANRKKKACLSSLARVSEIYILTCMPVTVTVCTATYRLLTVIQRSPETSTAGFIQTVCQEDDPNTAMLEFLAALFSAM